MRRRLEKIVTPFVRVRVYIKDVHQLQAAISSRLICDGSLAIALHNGLRDKRRFLLRPGPRDW